MRQGDRLVPGYGAFPLACRVADGRLIKHAGDAFDNVVDVGKVAEMFGLVKDLDRVTP
jgi:hypothetical protein